jgi:hypothetical protein
MLRGVEAKRGCVICRSDGEAHGFCAWVPIEHDLDGLVGVSLLGSSDTVPLLLDGPNQQRR